MTSVKASLARDRRTGIVQSGWMAGGGDCARMVPRSDGRALFFLGDVAGHDRRAAALAAQASAIVSELGILASPGRLLTLLNATVEASWPSDVFICAVCFVLDPRTGRGTISAAGHFPPVVRGASSCRALDLDAGPALGLFAEQRYSECEFTLGAVDVLIAVTDGVTDPMATRSDPLGLAALAGLIGRVPGGPDDLCSSLMNASLPSRHPDDATVLAVAPVHHHFVPRWLSRSAEAAWPREATRPPDQVELTLDSLSD